MEFAAPVSTSPSEQEGVTSVVTSSSPPWSLTERTANCGARAQGVT